MGDLGSIPGSGRSPGDLPTPVFLPEKSHRQRSLAGYSPWGWKESDMMVPTAAVLNNVRVTKLTFLVLFANLPSLQYYRLVNFYFSPLTKSL